MRLILISSEFPPGPGGIGTHAYQLARHLVACGHEVLVLASQYWAAEEEIAAFNQSQPFRVIGLTSRGAGPLKAMGRSAQIVEAIRSFRPEMLLGTGKRAVWLTALWAGWYKLPWIAVGHGTEFGSAAGWDRAVSRRAFGHASAVVCVSRYTEQQMLKMGVRAQSSHVVHNGADAGQFRKLPDEAVAHRRRPFGGGRAPLLITVGRVSERKGQDVVIRALPQVLQRVPDVHYLIAGVPAAQEEFARLAKSLGVEAHVHFLGRLDGDEVVELLNCCDLFVMTSKRTAEGDFEGYGIAVIEAAMCGRTAVVSRESGLAEAVIDGETGITVAENDESATAEAIIRLLTDGAERKRMEEAAHRRAITTQTWPQQLDQYNALLTEIARGG